MPLRCYITALLMLSLAGFFTWMFHRDWAAWNWTSVPCDIVRCQTGAVAKGHLPDVEYRYKVGGVAHTGHRFTPGRDDWATTREVAQNNLRAYRPGPALCYIDPRDADQSCLSAPESWSIAFIPMILLLWILLEHVALVEVWQRHRRGRLARQPLSQCDEARACRPITILVALFSLGAGCGLLWLCEIQPRREARQASDWLAIPCQIERSRVRASGRKIDLDVSYSYPVAGATYYVNPGNPRQSVLSRSFYRSWVLGLHGPTHSEKWERQCLRSWPVASLDLSQQLQGELRFPLPAESMHTLVGRFFALRWVLVAQIQHTRFEYPLEVAP